MRRQQALLCGAAINVLFVLNARRSNLVLLFLSKESAQVGNLGVHGVQSDRQILRCRETVLLTSLIFSGPTWLRSVCFYVMARFQSSDVERWHCVSRHRFKEKVHSDLPAFHLRAHMPSGRRNCGVCLFKVCLAPC